MIFEPTQIKDGANIGIYNNLKNVPVEIESASRKLQQLSGMEDEESLRIYDNDPFLQPYYDDDVQVDIIDDEVVIGGRDSEWGPH